MEAGATKKEPKSQPVKAGEDDLSMEEILQSIRRIIADDDNEGKKPVSADKNGKGKGEDDVPGSDMLELTEMLKDDGTVVNLKKEAAAAKPVAAEAEPASYDILSQIDQALETEKPVEAPAPVMAEPAAVETPAPVAQPPVQPSPQPSAQNLADSLMSDTAAAATADAFRRLKNVEPEPSYAAPATALPTFLSGTSIEDMVGEMLRPMLKQWLDTNLPAMVQQIVEREIKKLTR